MKLSKRLQQIEQMVTSDYTHIWDCCCDHGFLGTALLSRQPTSQIHFVDIVPELMAELDAKLQRLYSDSATSWKTHCLDVAELPLEQHAGKQLIIIAGVGGDLMVQFIEAIHQTHPNLNIDFLLCPVHHQFTLRQKLVDLDFSLKDESLIEDKQHFYEVILVSSATNENAPINPVGHKIWQSASAEQRHVIEKYLNKKLNHYYRIQQGKNANVEHIIEAYRTITL